MRRRDLLRGLGTVAAAGAIAKPRIDGWPETPVLRGNSDFPRKADFRIAEGYTYINGAYTPPDADRGRRGVPPGGRSSRVARLSRKPPSDPKAAFASLINAKPDEISFIPNTSTGENLVIECLGIRRNDGNVVTDALHFEGALITSTSCRSRALTFVSSCPARTGSISATSSA
jgi:hypothetical protein